MVSAGVRDVGFKCLVVNAGGQASTQIQTKQAQVCFRIYSSGFQPGS